MQNITHTQFICNVKKDAVIKTPFIAISLYLSVKNGVKKIFQNDMFSAQQYL